MSYKLFILKQLKQIIMIREKMFKNKKQKVFFSVFATLVIIFSIFTVITFSKISALTEKIDNKGKNMSVKIFADKKSGYTPFTVNFSSILVNSYKKMKYFWDFGDGTTSNNKNPRHTYHINASCTCKLLVKSDDGVEATDSMNIISLYNQAPRVSILISSTTPQRDFKFRPSYLILRWGTKKMGGRNLHYMKNLSIAPLSSEKSNIDVSALVEDPEKDEIVSYKWELRPPVITLFGMRQYYPNHVYTGKNVTFDLLDIYQIGKYDLVLTVEDAAGNIDVETISFKVEENSLESQTYGMLGYYKEQWLKQFSEIPAIKKTVAGLIGFILYRNIISEKTSFPLIKLIFMAILSSLKLPPEEYGNETMLDVCGQFLDKYEFLKPVTKKLFDNMEMILIKNGKEKESDILQIIEEQIGLDNNRPQIKDQFPGVDDINIPRLCPFVSINVTDKEGDIFNVTISGDYINNITYNDVTNNTFNAIFNYPTTEGLPSREEIIWNVRIIDRNGKKIEDTYKFTTFV